MFMWSVGPLNMGCIFMFMGPKPSYNPIKPMKANTFTAPGDFIRALISLRIFIEPIEIRFLRSPQIKPNRIILERLHLPGV